LQARVKVYLSGDAVVSTVTYKTVCHISSTTS